MKRIYLILAMLCVIAFASAQALSLSFMPHTMKLNRLSTFDLDPVNPQQQADFTTLTIRNNGDDTISFDLGIELQWNDSPLIADNELEFRSKEALISGESLAISNRELVSQTGNLQFEVTTQNVDILERAKKILNLKDALMAGYFPDGVLQLKVKARPVGARNWSEPAVFKLEIRNLGAIYLSNPGSQINQVPPKLSEQTLSFFWSAFVPEFNEQKLIIKEFPPNLMPQSHNVNRAGAIFYESEAGVESGVILPLALNDGCYYAWKVYIDERDIHNPYQEQRDSKGKNQMESAWYVFQYIEDQDESEVLDGFYMALQNLGDHRITNLLTQGYRATGEISLDGRVYRGQDALDIIESLMGKYFQVEILD